MLIWKWIKRRRAAKAAAATRTTAGAPVAASDPNGEIGES